jgi:hypothetical protein
MNMNDCVDLEMRLLKNKTIEKIVQKQINRKKYHWKRVLLRIIVIIKNIDCLLYEDNDMIMDLI